MREIKIKRFFECLIPVTICNLKCSYCYVIQRNYRNLKLAEMEYSPEHIGRCLTKERLGGSCFFSICGAGETLAQKDTLLIARELLKNGHIINITTNGTLSNAFTSLREFSEEELSRMHFSFSFHYLELKRLNLLDKFIDNVKLVHSLGASYIVQLNLCDDYLPYLDDIKKICLDNFGAYPQIAATRKEKKGLKFVELETSLSRDEYEKLGNSFNSELFKFTMENFNRKRNEFCYAGDRTGTLDLSTGMLSKCYADPFPINIFDHPEEPIPFAAVGKNCRSSFCFNSSHFMSLGVIDNGDTRTYCGIRDRAEAGWFNETMKYALSNKLSETNPSYSAIQRLSANFRERNKNIKYFIRRVKRKLGSILKEG